MTRPPRSMSSRREADQFFKDITPAERSRLPAYTGEMELQNHSAGSLTSQAYQKRWIRENEILADGAEKASVAAMWLGGRRYPIGRLNDAWTLIMGSHFHDLAAGTATPRAYEFAWNDDVIAMNQMSDVLQSGSEAVASAMNTTNGRNADRGLQSAQRRPARRGHRGGPRRERLAFGAGHRAGWRLRAGPGGVRRRRHGAGALRGVGALSGVCGLRRANRGRGRRRRVRRAARLHSRARERPLPGHDRRGGRRLQHLRQAAQPRIARGADPTGVDAGYPVAVAGVEHGLQRRAAPAPRATSTARPTSR